jgi:hypothetical protein
MTVTDHKKPTIKYYEKPTIEYYEVAKNRRIDQSPNTWKPQWMVKYGGMESVKEAEEFILRHDMVEARAHRLALELGCLLFDIKELSIQSKWRDSAMVALTEWRELDQQPHVSEFGKD